MTFSILGISAAALTLSVIAIAGGPRQEGGQPTGVVFRSPAQQEATSDTLADIRLRIDMQDAPVGSFFDQAGKAAGKPVFVHWDRLPVEPEDTITLQLGEVSFPTALRLINTRLGRAGSDEAIDFRLRDGVLEFSNRTDFDQQEAQLVRYDLTPVLGRATPEEVVDLIHNLVDPYSWEANGGMTASLHLAGDQMFIKAPQRMFPKIEWILAQFAEEAEAEEADAAEIGDAISLRVIPLREADAGALGQSLEKILADLPGVTITTDARTNALLISATATWHDRIEALLPLLDRPASAAATPGEASAEKLRAAYQVVHASAITIGAFPQTVDHLLRQLADQNLLGILATSEHFTAPDGQRYWLDLPAMQTVDSRRIVGYDGGAFARGEVVATLFADGHVEVLAPLRLRDLMESAPDTAIDFDLPEQQVGAAPGPAAPVSISADQAGQVACRWTDADGREHTLRASTISFEAADVTCEGAVTYHPGS